MTILHFEVADRSAWVGPGAAESIAIDPAAAQRA
jgi:hypothetical protein